MLDVGSDLIAHLLHIAHSDIESCQLFTMEVKRRGYNKLMYSKVLISLTEVLVYTLVHLHVQG
jgi:hypothetical protein